ncbi:hypothetical protein C8J56DRAFT_1028535 [Mycena floridula]|nr:hypothetical protein C8J56DRAFT_1028535 [Mycena floridula]
MSCIFNGRKPIHNCDSKTSSADSFEDVFKRKLRIGHKKQKLSHMETNESFQVKDQWPSDTTTDDESGPEFDIEFLGEGFDEMDTPMNTEFAIQTRSKSRKPQVILLSTEDMSRLQAEWELSCGQKASKRRQLARRLKKVGVEHFILSEREVACYCKPWWRW